MALDEGFQVRRCPAPAGEGDVRVEGTAFGWKAGSLAGAFDFLGKCLELLFRGDAGP